MLANLIGTLGAQDAKRRKVKMKSLRLSLVVGCTVTTATLLGSLTGCGNSGEVSSDIEISRNDPDYSSYSPGYNYLNGKQYFCKYKDPTVIREVASSSSVATLPINNAVEPGLHDTDRATVVSAAKKNAISTLRQYAPTITQIGSCDLACVEVHEPMGSQADAGIAFASPGSEKSAEDGANEASTTNNQVAGVDEADFIKNDNKYMYIVANNQLKIIDAWPAKDAKTLSTVKLAKGTPTQLFLGSTRLVVYSAVGGNSGAKTPTCTYGFDCVPTGDGTATHVTIFDITNKSAPFIVREIDLSGSLIAARKIGDAIHTVVYDGPVEERMQQLAVSPSLPYQCFDRRDDIDKVAADFRRAVDERAAQIESLPVEGGPTLIDGVTPVEPTFHASNMKGNAFLSVASFGIDGAGLKVESLVSKPGFVYASSSALYVSVPHDQNEGGGGWYSGWGTTARASEVYRFAVGSTPSATQYEASGLVKGTVLNQFAMDQWDGNLRIATTSGRAPDPTVHSTVTILEKSGGNLTQKGIIDNIAQGEDIRSVRFDSDRGFLVTFKKTDPLFALDLGNAAAPKITGQLKIPGFSTYMHFMDRTHILAIGLEADDKGSYAYFNGIQLQIFDVNDMESPKLLQKTVIGTRGTTSEALTNHLGFNYFAPKNLLALPMTTCEGGGNGQFGTMTFNGLLVYDVTTAGGFSKRGGISHAVAPGVNCNNWWTHQNSTVKRSVIMDNFVYSVAEDIVKIADVTNLATTVAEVSLK